MAMRRREASVRFNASDDKRVDQRKVPPLEPLIALCEELAVAFLPSAPPSPAPAAAAATSSSSLGWSHHNREGGGNAWEAARRPDDQAASQADGWKGQIGRWSGRRHLGRPCVQLVFPGLELKRRAGFCASPNLLACRQTSRWADGRWQMAGGRASAGGQRLAVWQLSGTQGDAASPRRRCAALTLETGLFWERSA